MDLKLGSGRLFSLLFHVITKEFVRLFQFPFFMFISFDEPQILSSKQDQDLIDEKGTPLKQKTKGEQAKDLLAKYGGAYLATSITLSLISFTLCYALINAGVDVSALLQKVYFRISYTPKSFLNQVTYNFNFFFF